MTKTETCRGCGSTFATYECFNEVTGESDGLAEYCERCVAGNIGDTVIDDGTVVDSLGNFVGIDQPAAAAMREP